MKKTFTVLAAAALTGVLAVTASGCSTTSKNLASLSSNWYYDYTFKRIQPTFTGEENAEKLTYKVTQAEKSANTLYSVEHEDGTYTTTFYAKKLTATELDTITLENWREDYTKALSSDGYMYVYYYATELNIPSVTYKFGEQTATFTDQSVVSESYFLSVDSYLSPVYSKRTIKRTIPANWQPGSLEACYTQVDGVYESFYTLSGNDVLTKITDNLAENESDKNQTFGVGGMNDNNNSVFDSTYLDITVRALRGMSASLSQTVSLYTPGVNLRQYTLTGSATLLVDDQTQHDLQLSAIQYILEDNGLFTPKTIKNEDGTYTQSTLNTLAVSVAYNGGNYSGVSQTYWFAIGADNNETRTLMVKYAEPLTYSLGRLDYVLQSIDNIV